MARESTVDSGEGAFLWRQSQLDRIPAKRVAQPRAEVRSVASFVISNSVRRRKDRKLRERFLLLLAVEFPHGALNALAAATEAALYT